MLFRSRLAAVRSQFPSAEDIDDGAHTAPSKRILTLIPEYSKPVAGPQIAREIGLQAMRRECLHFNNWLTKLEALSTP